MATVTTASLIASIETVRNNPSAVQSLVYDTMDAVEDGTIDVVDPTNPFAFLIESMSCLAVASMSSDRITSRELYPSMSVTQNDLYRHMSDKDYVGRFATPAMGTFSLYLGLDELKQRAVSTGVSGVSKLTIPKNTTITVGGCDFTMQYPIDIRVLQYDGIQVTYDPTNSSPLQSLETNVIPTTTIPWNGVTYLVITFDVLQMSVKSQKAKINTSSGLKQTYAYTDSYFYARVYGSDSAGNWTEIATTYSKQVFDPTVPTALITVNPDTNTIDVSVDQIYITTGMLVNELRTDLYTTKGPINLQLANYPTLEFAAVWQDFDSTDNGVYYAPLNNFQGKGINSVSNIQAGEAELTFDALRAQVINNTNGPINYPITNVDLSARAAKLGYGLVVDVDNITNRQFLATRNIDAPTDGSVTTGAGVSMNTLSATIEQLAALDTVIDNGTRITVLPSTLYSLDNGVVSLVAQSTIDTIEALDADALVEQVNANDFLFTPFHYVLDTTDNTFESRPYYLAAPQVTLKTAVAENASTNLTVATDTYSLVSIDSGFQLRTVVTSSSTYKNVPDAQLFAQLCFIPEGETEYAYLNGVLQTSLVNGERVWVFPISTNYDIDGNDNICLTSFSMFDEGQRQHYTALSSNYQLIYGVLDYNTAGQTTSVIDTIVGLDILSGAPTGVTQEAFTIAIGSALNQLWRATRSVTTSEVYATHTTNVPLLYDEDVYEVDQTTGLPSFTQDGNGVPQFTILHAAGSPVLDASGNQAWKHLAGDIILDNTGQPLTVLNREMSRQLDLMMIDGIYWWATNLTTTKYRDGIASMIAEWLTVDLVALQQVALEQTEIYYYPKSTVGLVEVTTQDGVTTSIASEQVFTIIYYLSETAYASGSFTAALRSSTLTILSEQLDADVVSTDTIVNALRGNVSATDVLGISVQGLGGDQNLVAVSMSDASQRLTISKALSALADGSYTVIDDINISFVPFKTASMY